jgi:LuxR family transcriptional regulator of csgAB operon
LFDVPNGNTDASFPNIYIVGPSLVQNQLLALFLEKKLTVACTCQTDLCVKEIIDTAPEGILILLLDCCISETAEFQKCLPAVSAAHTDNFRTALFSVDPASRIEKLVHRHKVRGIFYKSDSRQVFLKGMRTILKGGMWLPRRILSACVLSSSDDDHFVTPLSGREKETLWLAAKGFCNDEIAEKMSVSHHTIKTHLYHVYKKIGASNRLQAAVWAASYLSEYPEREALTRRTGNPSL